MLYGFGSDFCGICASGQVDLPHILGKGERIYVFLQEGGGIAQDWWHCRHLNSL